MRSNNKALSLIECVAAIAVMVPIMIGCCMAIQEVSQAYQIKQGLAQAARQAARDMAAAYAQSKQIDGSREVQNSFVYNKVKVPGAVTHPTQFDTAVFETSVDPKVVSVTVHYKSNGSTELPAFPTFDPINLGSNFDLNATATYALD
jgi:Flp pilus assembly protein TadG